MQLRGLFHYQSNILIKKSKCSGCSSCVTREIKDDDNENHLELGQDRPHSKIKKSKNKKLNRKRNRKHN